MIESPEVQSQSAEQLETLQDGWVAPHKNGHKPAVDPDAQAVAAAPDNRVWQENLQEGWSQSK